MAKMRQIKWGKHKGKWIVLDSKGKRAYPKKGGTTRSKARSIVSARNIGCLRKKGYKIGRKKKR